MASIEYSREQDRYPAPRLVAANEPGCPALERAIVQTVAYSDIFDYPLTAAEIHRYLIGLVATDVAAAAGAALAVARGRLAERDGYYTLPGRVALAATRQERAPRAARLWPRALRYGRIIAALPFVRMVAITGELAMDNVQPHSDVDYFIVTAPGRLWLCRLLVIGLVRAARPWGITICPNYLLTERALVFEDRNLYTAHEVAQMTPLAGVATYRRLRELNGWVADYLPNAGGPPRRIAARPGGRWARGLAVAERALGGRLGARLERWEMERKIRKLGPAAAGNPEAAYAADWCKGHVSGHEDRIVATFTARWQALDGRKQ